MQRITPIKRTNYENVKQLKVWLYKRIFEDTCKVLYCRYWNAPYVTRNTKIDAGHILENVLYLELLRRGYKVFVGKVDHFEVDFVAQNSKGIEYYQVALTVRDEKIIQRELRPLQAIQDHYPKVILTMDDDPEVQYERIRRINARDWLLGLTE